MNSTTSRPADAPVIVAQPEPAPLANHSDFSEVTLSAYLDRLEGWKPKNTDQDAELAQAWIEWLDISMNMLETLSPLWIRTLRRLAATCRRSEQLPSNLRTIDIYSLKWVVGEKEFTDIGERKAVTAQGQADIFKCKHQGQPIALKVYRVNNSREAKPFYDEVVIWSRVQHRNIVPLVGKVTGFEFALASEWMEYGNITQFFELNPNENRTRYMKDIVSGLAFLHSIGVLHADLKGPNVLVDADKTARLVDFGISQISSATHTHALTGRGTDFYKAPEYDGQISMATKESDIFSLAHLLVDLFLPPIPAEAKVNSEGIPIKPERLPEHIRQRCLLYADFSKTVLSQMLDGVRPSRPSDSQFTGLTDDLWNIIQKCWTTEPALRPAGWKLLVKFLEVAAEDVDVGQAQQVAAQIQAEDAPPSPDAPEEDFDEGPSDAWLQWPHTHGGHISYLIYRHIHPLLDYKNTTRRPLIDLAFHRPLFMQEDSDDATRFEAKPIPADDLARSLFAEEQIDTIRYIDVKCALIPDWRARINERTLCAAMSRPPSLPAPPSLPKDLEASPKTGLFCGLLPRRLSGSRRSGRSTPTGPDKSISTISNNAPTVTITRSPSPFLETGSTRLTPPVPDKEIQSLRELTIGDVFTGVYNALHEPISVHTYDSFMPEQQAKLTRTRRNRGNRARDVKSRDEHGPFDELVIYADLLADESMLEGFIVTQVDGQGGMELELLTRARSEVEVRWYQAMQVQGDASETPPVERNEMIHNLTAQSKVDAAAINLDERSTLVQRKLHPSLDYQDSKRSIDFSFPELLLAREHPSRRIRYQPRRPDEPDLEFISDEELSQMVTPNGDIRYMDITCALLPGWKAFVNERLISAAEAGQPAAPVSLRYKDNGPDPGPGPSGTRSRSSSIPEVFIVPSSLGSLGGRPKDVPSGAFDAASSSNEKPVAQPLLPPVADADIPSLRPLTVRDVLRAIFDALQDTMSVQSTLEHRDIEQVILEDTSRRRRLRSLSGQIQTQHLMQRFMRVDWLVDEHMFDGLVVTKVDGKGGMEAELLTRMPTVAELSWYDQRLKNRN